MDNLHIYEAVRTVPEKAKKEILGGKLKGKTDINPMWRIKALTEQFGPCGIGWKPEITKKEAIPAAGGEMAVFVDVNLYVKVGDTWSDAIPGTGGSMLVQTEKGNLVSNDEAFKMAYTDALSVACKLLGVGADVYWEKDSTKYGAPPEADKPESNKVVCPKCGRVIAGGKDKSGNMVTPSDILSKLGCCAICYKKEQKEQK